MTWRDDPTDNAQPICPQCLTNDHIDTLDSIPGHDPNARWTCRPCNLVFNGTIAERNYVQGKKAADAAELAALRAGYANTHITDAA